MPTQVPHGAATGKRARPPRACAAAGVHANSSQNDTTPLNHRAGVRRAWRAAASPQAAETRRRVCAHPPTPQATAARAHRARHHRGSHFVAREGAERRRLRRTRWQALARERGQSHRRNVDGCDYGCIGARQDPRRRLPRHPRPPRQREVQQLRAPLRTRAPAWARAEGSAAKARPVRGARARLPSK